MFQEYFTEQTRKRFEKIYLMLKNNNFKSAMEGDEVVLQLMKEHQSYLEYWVKNGFDKYEWSEKEINPFMHILMHYIVESYLIKNSELQVPFKKFYQARKRKFMKHHEIVHMLAQLLAANYFPERRREGTFSLNSLVEDLNNYSTSNKAKFWKQYSSEDEENSLESA